MSEKCAACHEEMEPEEQACDDVQLCTECYSRWHDGALLADRDAEIRRLVNGIQQAADVMVALLPEGRLCDTPREPPTTKVPT